MENETWLPVVGYESRYEVSDLGRVRNIKRNFILKIFGGNKYCNVKLIDVRYLLHRVVAMAFLPNPNNLPQVNHIDGNKENNILSNLEWCTRAENYLHAFRIGLKTHVGTSNPKCKLTEDNVLEIYNSQAKGIDLAAYFNVTSACVSCIKSGKIWSHITNHSKAA